MNDIMLELNEVKAQLVELEKALDFSSVISMLSALNTPRYLRAEHMVLQHLLDCKLLAPEAYTPAGASTADLIRELLNDAPKKEG
jgi:hypothetical protein